MAVWLAKKGIRAYQDHAAAHNQQQDQIRQTTAVDQPSGAFVPMTDNATGVAPAYNNVQSEKPVAAKPEMDRSKSGLTVASDVKASPSELAQNQEYFPTPAVRETDGRSKMQVILSRARIMAGLLLCVYVESLDYTIVSTAQQRIASEFNSLQNQTWIGTAYLLTSCAFLPIYASVTDIFGRLLALEVAMLIFMIGTGICTGAQSMVMLLAGRGIAGVGAAGSLASVRVIMSDSANLADNAWQSTALVLMYTVGMVTGPIIGGALADINWRWVFGISLPIGAAAMVAAFVFLRGQVKGPQPPRKVRQQLSTTYKESFGQKLLRIDWVAGILFTVALILIMIGLNDGSQGEWSDVSNIVCLAVGGGLLVPFFLWEVILTKWTNHHAGPSAFKSTDTMLPLEIFKIWDICACSFAALASGAVMFSNFYFIALYYIIVQNKTATAAGTALLYFAPGMGIGSVAQGKILGKIKQPRVPIFIGQILTPVGVGLMSMAINNNNQSHLNGYMVLTGTGVGLTFGPLAMQTRFTAPENLVATSTVLNLFFRTLGGTIGLAQLGTVMNSVVRKNIRNDIMSLPATSENQLLAAMSSLDSIDAIAQLSPDLQALVRNAFQDGVRWAFISLLPWCGIALILCLGLKTLDWERRAAEEAARQVIHPPERETA